MTLSAPRLWIEQKVSGQRAISARADGLIAVFAERHVALTPALAEGLVRLEVAEVPRDADLWGDAFRLAGQAVGQEAVLGRTRFWRGSVPVFHTTVAEPILRRAMHLAGPVGLEGGADFPPRAKALNPKTESWAPRFEAAVRRLLADSDGMGHGFWIETALCLQAAAFRDAETRAGRIAHRLGVSTLQPEPEPLLCRLLFQAEPEFPEAFRLDYRRIKARLKSQRKRAGHRPKEGGVSGIRASSLVDDLPDALISELVLPKRVVMDRLLNEGLIVRHRPPFRQPKRDLLVVGLADRTSVGIAGAVAKAAWADMALRLQIVLGQMGLPHSDLLWSEARPTGFGADLLRVEDAEATAGLDALMLSGQVRASRLFRSGLMPGFPESIAPGQPATGQAAAPEDAVGLLTQMAQAALQRLRVRHRVGRGHLGPRAEISHQPSDYGRRIAIVVLPPDRETAERARTDWGSVRGPLTAGLGRVLEQDLKLVGVLVPAQIEPGAGFGLVGDLVPGGLEEVSLDPDLASLDAINRVLGTLSAGLMTAVLGAIDAG